MLQINYCMKKRTTKEEQKDELDLYRYDKYVVIVTIIIIIEVLFIILLPKAEIHQPAFF